MEKLRMTVCTMLVALSWASGVAFAQNINLLPKYGTVVKDQCLLDADAQFLSEVDAHYKGDRKQAAHDVAVSAWKILRQGNAAVAMRRFNQAWLIDSQNGSALWGMAIITGKAGNLEQSLKLFAEAADLVGGNVDFAADHARHIGIAAAKSNDEKLFQDAFARFAQVYERAPQHALNLQNWAITHYYLGQYAQAWEKLTLAEAVARQNEIDPRFVAALQEKMARPQPVHESSRKNESPIGMTPQDQ